MTALALTTSAWPRRQATAPTNSPGAVIDWSQWILADEAAKLLEKNPGHFRRKCEPLKARGLAMVARPPEGGNARWYVLRKYSVKLGTGPLALSYQASKLSDLEKRYTAKQRRHMHQRAACVKVFREAQQTWPGLQKDWLAKLINDLQAKYTQIKISRSRLAQWAKLYRDDRDLEKLVDRRGGDFKSCGHADAWLFFSELFLDDREPALLDSHRRTRIFAESRGITWCSEDSCRRQLDERIIPEVQLFHRQPAKWRQSMRPTISLDPESYSAGDCWVGDHAQLDFMCRFGKSLVRPWITAWMDWRTRKVVGFVLSTSPNSSTILAALHAGLADPKNLGGPSLVWIDNGRDYDAWMFHGQTKRQRFAARGKRDCARVEYDEAQAQGIYHALSIDAHFARPFNGNGKSRMERWFGTLHGQFDKSYKTYCGRSVTAKPEGLKAALNSPACVPQWEQVVKDLREYVAAYNARTAHNIDDLVDEAGTRLSPDQAMATWRTTRRVLADPGALDLLLQHWERPVRMGANGITIRPLGKSMTYGGTNTALSAYKALKAGDRPLMNISYDPADISRVRVFDAQWRFITEAKLNDYGGGAINRDRLKSMLKDQREYAKSLKFVSDRSELAYLKAAEVLELTEPQGTDPHDKHPTPQPDVRLIQTPIDGASKDVQQDQFRQAAGGEFTTPSRSMHDVNDFFDDMDLGGSYEPDDDATDPLMFAPNDVADDGETSGYTEDDGDVLAFLGGGVQT
jgi:transposase InsO family protein